MQICQARERYLRWLHVTRDLSPHTIRAYDGDIAALERHLGSKTIVSAIDRERVVAFIESQQAVGLSPLSIRRRASALRGFCKWLVTDGLLVQDPCAGASVAVGRARKLPRVVPTQDLDRLFRFLRAAAAPERTAHPGRLLDTPHAATTLLAVALMVTTGARVNEVVSIKWRDVDTLDGNIRIIGKGRRERQVFLTNDWIKDLVRRYLETRAALRVTHPYLLFNRHGARLTEATMRSRLQRAAKTAGLDLRVTPHMLRHTAATRLIEAGVDIRCIQRLLGHSSLTTTEIYTHVSDSALRRVISEADILGVLMHQR